MNGTNPLLFGTLVDVLASDIGSGLGAIPVLNGTVLHAEGALGAVMAQALHCQAQMIPFVIRGYPPAMALRAGEFQSAATLCASSNASSNGSGEPMIGETHQLCTALGHTFVHEGRLFTAARVGAALQQAAAPRQRLEREDNVSLGAWLGTMRPAAAGEPEPPLLTASAGSGGGGGSETVGETVGETVSDEPRLVRHWLGELDSLRESAFKRRVRAALTPIPDQLSGRGEPISLLRLRLGRESYETTIHVDRAHNWILDLHGSKRALVAHPFYLDALGIALDEAAERAGLSRNAPYRLLEKAAQCRAARLEGGRGRGGEEAWLHQPAHADREEERHSFEDVAGLSHVFAPADLLYVPFQWPHYLDVPEDQGRHARERQRGEDPWWMTLGRFHYEFSAERLDLGVHGPHIACTSSGVQV